MLISLINQHALSAAQAGDWQSVATTLNALTQEVRITELRTARWLMLQLTDPVGNSGMTEADVVLGTLQQSTIPRVKAAYDSLCNDGIDLSDSQVRQMIPLLAQAASWPAGLAQKILDAGRPTVAVLNPATNAIACEAAWRTEQVRLLTQKWHEVDQQIRAGIENQTLLVGDIASKVAELMA
jgi:hypothetical protein